MSESSSFRSHQGSRSLPLWVCELEKNDQPWTVGEKRELSCQGEEIEKFKTLPEIVFPEGKENLKYSLYILEIKKSAKDQASFLVTGYKPGEYTSSSFFILSHETGVEVLNPFSWKVESTLKTRMGALKPHGPRGPFLLSWPFELKVIGFFLVLFIFCFLSFRCYKFFLRKYWKKKMLQFLTPFSPYRELNKEIRRLLRKYPIFSYLEKEKKATSLDVKGEELSSIQGKDLNSSQVGLKHKRIKRSEAVQQTEALQDKNRRNYIKGLEESFRMYLTRVFLIPAHKLKMGLLIKEIKLRKKMKTPQGVQIFKDIEDFKGFIKELHFLMSELQKVSRDGKKLKIVDCDHLTQWVRKWAERVDKKEITSFKKELKS